MIHDQTGACCPSRRDFAAGTLALLAAAGSGVPAFASAGAAPALTADAALARMIAGNKRFVSGKGSHPDQGPAFRKSLAASQHPFAIVLGCSDSRVPPEIVFDQGLGELFTIRIAGAVYDDPGLGSMEYAVEHFHSPLLVVMGHEKCGAVIATVDAVAKPGGPAPGHIGSLVDRIKAAAESVRNAPGDPVDNAVRANVKAVVASLKAQPIMANAIKAGSLKIVGARYALSDGSVSIIA